MCGIMGYIGKERALPLIIEGLRRESYRGYDSSGVVVLDKNRFQCFKSVGNLENLEKKLKGLTFDGNTGIGHNRWATHGQVTERNAHPHADCKRSIFVVHNGIIENYQLLKKKLEKEGHRFVSQTDTEIIPHLIEKFFRGNLEEAVRQTLQVVKGAYSIAVICSKEPQKIVAARFSAPLVLSFNHVGGFVASDPSALIPYSDKMVFLKDGEMAVLTKNSFLVTDLNNNKKRKIITKTDWNIEESRKGNYKHFMLKEIMEQPKSLANALQGRLLVKEGLVEIKELESLKNKLKNINKIQIIACGSASYAAKFGEYIIEELLEIPVFSDIGSEFRYRNPVFDKKTLSIFISQSGETADTLAALSRAKTGGGLTVGVVNVAGSTLARGVGFKIYNRSGPEIAVATTKAFTSQLLILVLLALFLRRQRGLLFQNRQKTIKEINRLPQLTKDILDKIHQIELLAKKYQNFNNFWVIGRKYNYPIALECALKLKEVCYINANGIAAGELKHGPIALVDEKFPTIAICPSDSVYEKMVSNIQEIKARNGLVIAVANEGNKDIKKISDDVIYIPKTIEILTPILTTIALQLLSYYIASEKGLPIDRPRNLAKSVTVE